jgi:hypothetical protein
MWMKEMGGPKALILISPQGTRILYKKYTKYPEGVWCLLGII